MTVFSLPDLGEGLQSAEIVAWQVSVGDHVIADQPLVSVETDKAVVEIPAPFSGTVKALLVKAGDIVATDAPLVEITTGKAEDSGAIVGDLVSGKKAAAKAMAQAPSKTATDGSQTAVKATPAVRKLAREEGVDLSVVAGSGPDGAILSADVLSATSGLARGEELRGVRRAMAMVMTNAHANAVPATVTDHADIHNWLPGEVPTLRLVQAIAAACKAEPALNAWFDGTRRQLHNHVDLALAVDTADGLFTPVLRAVEAGEDIPEKIAALRAAIETRSISPRQMKGATITLSNFGMIGGEHAVLVVVPPQVAILGAGRITDAIVVAEGAPAVRRLLPLSLTFDHRVVTGGEAARFLAALRAHLEQPNITRKE
ncbi:dihydrolipoamide acetyltransferase family protein [Pseudohalocynthiibacter aestuariivivens]|uniref:Dihydrolipoamide acetyltransferase component of pyruvate dehydrogenase complex n=1 Tax=Pseudohalocynthiibacter aestuariivivens TaxID=1591409 RepID=A0ABV5JGC2_9RHOB|nr:dihydrolipoamide acetyltransferase family protein [Pseudohalocynthiibacter aestuariivivens]MBS9717743.1 2-oxo acid dehydrogenase subunit E2 [Pseudohalocynthiibacter aestuariivivens]